METIVTLTICWCEVCTCHNTGEEAIMTLEVCKFWFLLDIQRTAQHKTSVVIVNCMFSFLGSLMETIVTLTICWCEVCTCHNVGEAIMQ